MIVDSYTAEQMTWPRVTGVLGAVGIVDYDAIPSHIREAALERGRDAHMICDSIDRGEPDYWSDDEAMAGYAMAWEKFRAETGFEPTLVEAKVVHPERRYRGRLDRVGALPGEDAPVIVDIKSGIVAEWTRLQLAAYASCLEKPWRLKRLGVQIGKDGRYTVSKPFNNFRRDQEYFFACVNVVHARDLYGKAFMEDAA